MKNTTRYDAQLLCILSLAAKAVVFCASAVVWVGTSISLNRPTDVALYSGIAAAVGIIFFLVETVLVRKLHKMKETNDLQLAAAVLPFLAVTVLFLSNSAGMFIILAGYFAGFVLADMIFLAGRSLKVKTSTIGSVSCLIAILLFAYTVVAPGTYAMKKTLLGNSEANNTIMENSCMETANKTLFESPTTNNTIADNRGVETTNASTYTRKNAIRLIAEGFNISVDCYEIHNGSEEVFVQFEANLEEGNCTAFKVKGPDGNVTTYPVLRVTTSIYPLKKLIPEESTSTSQETGILSTDPLKKYEWNGITFLQYPGNKTHQVEYDHPDDLETYTDIGPNEDAQIYGTGDLVAHAIAAYRIDDAKRHNNEGALLLSIGDVTTGVLAFILALLACPEPLVSKVIVAIVVLILAILGFVNRLVDYLLTEVIETETGNGWAYSWGLGQQRVLWWLFKFFYVSIGMWRDWQWFFVFVENAKVYREGDTLIDGRNPYFWYQLTEWDYYLVHFNNETKQLELNWYKTVEKVAPTAARIDGRYDRSGYPYAGSP